MNEIKSFIKHKFRQEVAILLVLSSFVSGCDVLNNKIQGTAGPDGAAPVDVPSGPQPTKLVGMSVALSEIALNEGIITNVTIDFNKRLPSDTSLQWRIQGGASDFAAASDTVSATQSSVKVNIPLDPTDDGLYEGDEVFNLEVIGDSNVFVAPIVVPVRIRELSQAPSISFALSSKTVTEGDAPTAVAVNLSQASANPITVTFQTSGSASVGPTGDAEITPPSTLTFAAGETQKTIQILVQDDTVAEPVEDVVLTLKTIALGTATIDQANKTFRLIIQDNDSAAPFTITGVRGGADSIADGFLSAGHTPTLVWSSAAGASSYQAVIYEENGTTIKCAPISSIVGTSVTFASCTLTEGKTYKASVVAQLLAGGTALAGNSPFSFINETTPPTDFSIIGVMGGADIVPDNYLSGSVSPTIVWRDADGESKYQITVYESNGITVKCAQKEVPANVQAYVYPAGDCTLTAGSNYKVQVTAVSKSGLKKIAITNGVPMFAFSVTSGASGYIVTGVTGGTLDISEDASMTDGLSPVIHWTSAAGAVSYDVEVFEKDGTTVKCPLVNIPSPAVSTTHSGCLTNLVLDEDYKVSVVARDSSGPLAPAANSPFTFRYMVGLFVSGAGAGGSYLNGVPIITCGGTNHDVCNAANPYVVSSALTTSQVRVASGGVIAGQEWVNGLPTIGNGILKISTDNLTLEGGGTISMTGRGYTEGNGPCAGTASASINYGGSGACYGGYGALNTSLPQSKMTYGSLLQPTDLGSGGGRQSARGRLGGAGGGAIDLTVNGTLNFGTGGGKIEADGEKGQVYAASGQPLVGAGSGSGGSVLLRLNKISGSGASQITASGGDVVKNGVDVSTAGAGSGGRVAVYYKDASTYTNGAGNIAAIAMSAKGGAENGSVWGAAAGTVFYKNESSPGGDTIGHLVVDNPQYTQGVETPLPVGTSFDSITTKNYGTFVVKSTDTYNLPSSSLGFRLVLEGVLVLPSSGTELTIASGGYLEWRKPLQITQFTKLTIDSGGELTHSRNVATTDYKLDISASSEVTVNSGGKITANGKGFSLGNGAGAGAAAGVGAGYGGIGGGSIALGRGSAYGDPRQPAYLGSSGRGAVDSRTGIYSGGAGGGYIHIVTPSLVLSGGEISANGAAGSSGGGSGGSIDIDATAIGGTTPGALNARGGNGNPGGGGGGRISVNYDSSSYVGGVTSISFSTVGGTGTEPGASGTVFHKKTGVDTNGHLIVQNMPNAYNEAVTTPILESSWLFDSITTDTRGTIEIPSGIGFQLPNGLIDYRLVVAGGFTLPGGVTAVAVGDNPVAPAIPAYGYLEWRQLSPLDLTGKDFSVGPNGIVTHTSNTLVKVNALSIKADNITLDGTVDVDGKGYQAGAGPGTPVSAVSGASYGGLGGLTDDSAQVQPLTYGDVKMPLELGSGGRGGNGQGGGAVFFDASGILTLNATGKISSNGRNGAGNGSSGGTGGSIYLKAGTIAGSGGASLQAVGGVSTGSTKGASSSGGRIALECGTDSYVGGLLAQMGTGSIATDGGLDSSRSGAAGTILIKVGASNGDLYIDNGARPITQFVETPVPPDAVTLSSFKTLGSGRALVPGSQIFTLPSSNLESNLVVQGKVNFPGVAPGDLTIKNSAVFEWRKPTKLALNSLTIENGGILTHTGNTITKNFFLDIGAVNVDIQAGGKIDLTGKGYTQSAGPGGTTSSTAGASHGGRGGAGDNGLSAPQVYGNVQSPNELGSGTKNNKGGGLLRVTASGTTTINGDIIVDGGIAAGTGGGSGGSIFIDTDTLAGGAASGDGKLFARGSDGSVAVSPDNLSGSAGGRIAILYNTDSFVASGAPSGIAKLVDNSSAGGGNGAPSVGAAGTIYYKNKSDVAHPNGYLVIKNPGRSYSGDQVTTPLPDGSHYDGVTVLPDSAVEVPVGTTHTLASPNLDYRLILAGDILLPTGNTLTIKTGGILEFRRSQPITFDNVVIENGGLITSTPNKDLKAYWVNLKPTVSLDLQQGGLIDVSGKGYAGVASSVVGVPGYGTGAGVSGANGSVTGASHGGLGYSFGMTKTTGPAYGSLKNPIEFGSAGGSIASTTGAVGGAGGGLVEIQTPKLILDGKISADGASSQAGGGAGGSINIRATGAGVDGLHGNSGVLTANGGSGLVNSTLYNGSGGGGRIAVLYESDNFDTLGGGIAKLIANSSAIGGDLAILNTLEKSGGAGSIFTRLTSGAEPNGRLKIDNGDSLTTGRKWTLGAESALLQTLSFDSVSISPGTGVYLNQGASLSLGAVGSDYDLKFPLRYAGMPAFAEGINIKAGGALVSDTNAQLVINGNLTVDAGAWLTHTQNTTAAQTKVLDIKVNGDMTMAGESTPGAGDQASIDVSGKGYGQNAGSGRGLPSSGTVAGSGGGHGGAGGSTSGSNGGITYGNSSDPITIGSGGGAGSIVGGTCQAGSGGGLVKIAVMGAGGGGAGVFDFNGVIKANGGDSTDSSCTYGAGAGAGGGINILTGTWQGASGTLEAKGGSASATPATKRGGGGGGGLVRVSNSVNSYDTGLPLVVKVDGGASSAGRGGAVGVQVGP